MNWDNLRYVLAVADRGSVSGAARQLGVTHATVLRRVAAFEAEEGGEVFEKSATGYAIRPERARVIEAAREVESAVLSVQRLMHGTRAPMRGRVRVSSTDSLCQCVLPAFVAEMRQAAPELRIELLSSNHHVDIARLQADITVRPALQLSEDMTGSEAVGLVFRAYAVPGVADQWLGLSGPLERSLPAQWMAKHVLREQVSSASDSFLVLAEMARAGLGVAILPAFLGDRLPGVAWQKDLMPDLSNPIWVATHVDLHDVPRIRLVRTYLEAFLARHGDAMSGRDWDAQREGGPAQIRV